MPAAIVLDVDILVRCVATHSTSAVYSAWPYAPPVDADPYAAVLGACADGDLFALYLSEGLLTSVAQVLAELGWQASRVLQQLQLLRSIAERSGGAIVESPEPKTSVAADLAKSVQARVVVSHDPELIALSGQAEGVVAYSPATFLEYVEDRRREARWRRFSLRNPGHYKI